MLTLSEVQEILTHVTYRPGWTITARAGFSNPIHLVINCTVENSYSPGDQVPLGINAHVPPMESTEQFLRWLHWRLRLIEIHESDEWFKLDGTPVFDPHMADADQDLGDGAFTPALSTPVPDRDSMPDRHFMPHDHTNCYNNGLHLADHNRKHNCRCGGKTSVCSRTGERFCDGGSPSVVANLNYGGRLNCYRRIPDSPSSFEPGVGNNRTEDST